MGMILVRHGETFFNLEDRLGGDSELTLKGIGHAEKIANWLKESELDSIYCSILKRSIQTAEIIHKYHPSTPLIKVPELREILSGDMDSLTYAEFESRFPKLFKVREKDKYHWSFPNGESYETAKNRVKPFLDGLKSKEGNYVVVGHRGMNRTILGYVLDLPKEEIPYLNIPNDVIFELNLMNQDVYHIKDGRRLKGYKINMNKVDV
ncbi:MAG: histidine phosphatase family protein [Nanoarchaeota archaeon]|nr:histidine phosphatase family protein [Nanoarchaeota archaeon]